MCFKTTRPKCNYITQEGTNHVADEFLKKIEERKKRGDSVLMPPWEGGEGGEGASGGWAASSSGYKRG